MPTVAKRAETDPAWREMFGRLQAGVDFPGADALLPLLYTKTETLCAYASERTLAVLSEPRSIFDDASRTYEDACKRAEGSQYFPEGLYLPPTGLDFGSAQRYTLSSIMKVGGMIDEQLPVKRTEIAGSAEKLIGRLRSLVDQRFTTVFSVPDVRARKDMMLLLVDNALPVVEVLDAELDDSSQDASDSASTRTRRSRRGSARFGFCTSSRMASQRAPSQARRGERGGCGRSFRHESCPRRRSAWFRFMTRRAATRRSATAVAWT